MTPIIIQILSLVLALLIIINSILNYRRHNESIIMVLFWSITWLIITLLTFSPDLLFKLKIFPHSLREDSNLGVVLDTVIIFIYFIIYRVYIKAERIERQLRNLQSDYAIKEFKRKYQRTLKRHSPPR